MYKPAVSQQSANTRTLKVWSREAEEALQDCLQTQTGTCSLDDHTEDIEELSQCITDYICFCKDSIVPTKKLFPPVKKKNMDK